MPRASPRIPYTSTSYTVSLWYIRLSGGGFHARHGFSSKSVPRPLSEYRMYTYGFPVELVFCARHGGFSSTVRQCRAPSLRIPYVYCTVFSWCGFPVELVPLSSLRCVVVVIGAALEGRSEPSCSPPPPPTDPSGRGDPFWRRSLLLFVWFFLLFFFFLALRLFFFKQKNERVQPQTMPDPVSMYV